MKNIVLILFTVLLSACAGGSGGDNGGGGTPTPHVPDNTPHDYTIALYMLTDGAQVHTGSLRQQCSVGFAGHRDEVVDYTFQDPINTGAMGCDDAKNVILSAVNTGAYELFVAITVDGVLLTAEEMGLPNQRLAPGQTFNFKRGF